MTPLKSLGGTRDDFTFWLCPNNDFSAYIKIPANKLAKFSERLKLYKDVPANKKGDENYIITRLYKDKRAQKLNISDPDDNGLVTLTLRDVHFENIIDAGGKIEREGKRIIHQGTPAEVSKVANILQINRFGADSKVEDEVVCNQLEGVNFLTCKDSPFLARLTSMAIYLPAADVNFPMVVQKLSEKRIAYAMDYNGLTVSGLEAISGVVALGGKFTGSEELLRFAGNMYRAA